MKATKPNPANSIKGRVGFYPARFCGSQYDKTCQLCGKVGTFNKNAIHMTVTFRACKIATFFVPGQSGPDTTYEFRIAPIPEGTCKPPVMHYFRTIPGSISCNQYWAVGLDCPHCEEGKMPEGYFGSGGFNV